MKTMVSILGTALLLATVALAQTSASSTGTSSKKSTSAGSNTYSSASSNNNTNTAAESNQSAVKAGNSGFDAGLPQSDSGAATSSTSAQSGSAAYGSGSEPTHPSAAMPQTASGTGANTSPSGNSDEITNGPVAETVSDSSATIGWSTRSAANGTSVKYGTNRASLSQTAQGSDGADGKNHHAKLQELSANTRYYFQVMVNGQAVGGIGTFKTTAAGETPVQSKAVVPQK